MNKITKREMFVAIKGLAESGVLESYEFADGITDDMVAEFCDKEIELLDKKAAKAKETAAKKKAGNDELTDAVLEALSAEEFEPIADIAARIEGDDVTVSKVTYRLGALVKAEKAEKQQITIEGGEGQKSRRVQAYRRLV